jgi:hypothetical protein
LSYGDQARIRREWGQAQSTGYAPPPGIPHIPNRYFPPVLASV